MRIDLIVIFIAIFLLAGPVYRILKDFYENAMALNGEGNNGS